MIRSESSSSELGRRAQRGFVGAQRRQRATRVRSERDEYHQRPKHATDRSPSQHSMGPRIACTIIPPILSDERLQASRFDAGLPRTHRWLGFGSVRTLGSGAGILAKCPGLRDGLNVIRMDSHEAPRARVARTDGDRGRRVRVATTCTGDAPACESTACGMTRGDPSGKPWFYPPRQREVCLRSSPAHALEATGRSAGGV
jgi:hypothetical protein